MADKITLKKIIEDVLMDKGIVYENANKNASESNERSLRRAFDRLIEKLGSDKEILKGSEGKFLFEEADIPFLKIIIEQLLDKDSPIAKFTNRSCKDINFSPEDVRQLIQSILDEANKNGANKTELEKIAFFFSSIFQYSPLRSRQYCHALIDVLASHLEDLPSSDQSIYLGKLEHILKKEYALRIAESTQHISAIAAGIDYTDGDIGNQYYYERNPEIRLAYAERDKRVLEKIQDDNDLRQYIEKKLGRKAEEIFNYAVFDRKPK